MVRRPTSPPRWVNAHSRRVLAARGDPEHLMGVFTRSLVPMLIVDDERRYVDANPPARAALALSLKELRQLRIDDLTPPYFRPMMESTWERLQESGSVSSSELAGPEGRYLGVSYYYMADVLPGRHLIAFVPLGWTYGNGVGDDDDLTRRPTVHLTRREREVLEAAAGGLNGPGIAKALVLSSATVRTHFAHIYSKLEVSDRAAAVAKAMRLGLIR